VLWVCWTAIDMMIVLLGGYQAIGGVCYPMVVVWYMGIYVSMSYKWVLRLSCEGISYLM